LSGLVVQVKHGARYGVTKDTQTGDRQWGYDVTALDETEIKILLTVPHDRNSDDDEDKILTISLPKGTPSVTPGLKAAIRITLEG
jgi:hypothetical protein